MGTASAYVIWWARIPGSLSYEPTDADGNPTSGWGLVRAYTDKDTAVREAKALEEHCECRAFGVVELGLCLPETPNTEGDA